ncbi:MAG: prolyl oligopeptidase family serine peptidase, partial [Solobacterium sp.]|nr:prolyl oligopeptidase family serine peptidase [Solobacterium sp.]
MKALKKFTAMALPLFTAFSLATPAIAEGEDAPTTTEVSFTLNAHVEEYGQVINQIVINADALGDVTPEDFDNETFKVVATAYETEDPSVYAYEDVERTIASVDARYSWTWGSWHGPLQVTINLETAFGAAGQGTLNWNMARFSNLDTTQVYTITLNKAVGALQPENVVFTQNGNYTDAEVDAFTSGSLDGTNYRLFTPANANDGALHPLILWLHGGGEGGTNNSSQLRANRGALGFVTPEAQEIFGGAYVLAPQAQAGWSDAERKNVKRIIDFLGMENNIDANRIYVAGCSMGGYGTNNIVADYPDYFAAAVPICSGTGLSDEEYIAAFSRQNVFYVHAANDDTVTVENSRHFKEIIPTAEYAEYPDVNVDGVDYPGHWSWIWFDMNDPVASDGQHIFQWMASKSLEKASFTMKGKVFDWGEGINQITLSVPGVNFSRSDVSVDTSKVLATGVYGNQTAFSKAERVVESVSMGNGTITLNLNCDFGAEGAGTLLYTGGRNQVLNLSYDIVQTKDITLRNGTVIPTNAYHYIQEGQWTDDEVDQFLYGQKDAVPYRLFIPANADDGAKHPLM